MMKKSGMSGIICTLCILVCMMGTAQPTTYKLNDTLPGVGIVTAVGENDEYRWIGTTNALIRISKKNGKQRVYTTSNSILPCGFITSICCRQNGHVWIGTLNGIVLNDGYCFFWMNSDNTQMPDNKISFIVEDKDQIVWVGTGKGLIKVRHNKFKVFDLLVKDIINEQNGDSFFITASDQTILASTLK